jgi:hypothetical protein
MTTREDCGQVLGGTYLTLDDNAKLGHRVDREAGCAEFVFLGPVEVTLDMPRDLIARCRDLLSEALAEIDEHTTERPDDEDETR